MNAHALHGRERQGTSLTPTCTHPQRDAIRQQLTTLGIDAQSVSAQLQPYLSRAGIRLGYGQALTPALQGMSFATAARLLRALKEATKRI